LIGPVFLYPFLDEFSAIRNPENPGAQDFKDGHACDALPLAVWFLHTESELVSFAQQ